MIKFLLLFAAFNGALATGLAAIASHHPALAGQDDVITMFSKANSQHYIHTVACLMTALAAYFSGQRLWLMASGLFALGVTLFSYTLYLFVFTGVKISGFLTPLGGVCFILAWLCIAVAALALPVCEKNNE